MAALNASGKDQQLVLMLSHEKTVRYAQAQIAEGELIAGKAILDSVLNQLVKQDTQDSQVMAERRVALIASIENTQEDIRQTRIKRTRIKNTAESS